jgi:phage gpG-like protein
MADFDIRIVDHTGEVMRLFDERLAIALNMVGMQAEAHAKQIISDSNVYGGVDLTRYGERDNSRVDTGRLRNSVTHTVVQNEVYIGSNVKYAAYHELGTGIYASQPGGRQTPWTYVDRHGVGHVTKGLYPIHFLKKSASEYLDEYKAILNTVLSGQNK